MPRIENLREVNQKALYYFCNKKIKSGKEVLYSEGQEISTEDFSSLPDEFKVYFEPYTLPDLEEYKYEDWN